MKHGRVAAVLQASLIALGLFAGSAAAREEPGVNPFARELLARHNAERDRVGVPRLSWSSKLAGEAQAWADVLAREGRMRHASSQERNSAGENLWQGSAGYYGADAMIGAFIAERGLYVPRAFPQVSKSGRWQDVGHYTQVVWRDTKEVGCAVARGASDDFLVCRYWPAGNWFGKVAY
jgi:uncharacterized protein YkwD